MGFALAAGLQRERPDLKLLVADPIEAQRERFDEIGIDTTASNRTAVQFGDIVVFAVKPQIIEMVATELRSVLGNSLVISIAAGTPASKLQGWLGENTPIVRCMPNTPALIGKGITGLIANEHVSETQRQLAESILAVCGQTLWFKSDDDLDKVTALSGSGPAYFFYLIDALVSAGTALNLDRGTALQLVLRTAEGASTMALDPASDPTELRQNVTSPGGTTEAALNQLAAANVDESFAKAVQAAYDRARELAK